MAAAIVAVQWVGEAGGLVRLIDQTLLPGTLTYRDCRSVEDVWEAIKTLRVRGAPAIGVTAAMGVVLGLRDCRDVAEFNGKIEQVCKYLSTSRPTAVNLFWALDRMERLARTFAPEVSPADRCHRLLLEARRIQEEDRQMCDAIGAAGASLIGDGSGVLTHCNTGGAGDGRRGDGPGGADRRRGPGEALPGVRGRNPAPAARGPADGLGTEAAGHSCHGHL